jgi:rhodanese-related sulfurtransferase
MLFEPHPAGDYPILRPGKATFVAQLHLNLEYQIWRIKMDFLAQLFGPPLPTITETELSEKLKDGKRPLVLDVRQPEEYSQGHIAGAKLIPLGQLPQRINELPKDEEIVCVCASGSRSSSATRMLSKSGYNAINMRGGMLLWQRAGLPVKRGN